jgi:choline monooxygenase
VFEWSNAQIGVGAEAGHAFDLPPDHPDAGTGVSGYYFWLFPNTMLNFYPWGISVNHVRPVSVDRTVVSFYAWVRDPARRDGGPGGALDGVEREDEAVVERAQRGVRSRLYDRGRFSPAHEQCVHHFHRLLARCLRVP